MPGLASIVIDKALGNIFRRACLCCWAQIPPSSFDVTYPVSNIHIALIAPEHTCIYCPPLTTQNHCCSEGLLVSQEN